MCLDTGSPNDAKQIAVVFREAFPESIELFYKNKPPDKLLALLELSFKLIFFWGGQAVVARNADGLIVGYCFFQSATGRPKRRYEELLRTAFSMVGRVSLGEVLKLTHNKLQMTLSCQRGKKEPRPQAHILSIAVSPSEQGQGLGRSLLDHALHQLQGQVVALNVRANNPAGQHLYAEAGFRQCGTTKDLLGDWLKLLRTPF